MAQPLSALHQRDERDQAMVRLVFSPHEKGWKWLLFHVQAEAMKLEGEKAAWGLKQRLSFFSENL